MKSASVRCDSKKWERRPPPEGRRRQNCGLRVVLVIGLTAAGLGEAAADHVADRQDRHVQPRLPGAEAAHVGLVDHAGRDQDAGQHGEKGEELGRLERRFGLRGQATRRARLGLAVAHGTIAPRGSLNCAHGSSREIADYENWTSFPTSATRQASFVPAKQKTRGEHRARPVLLLYPRRLSGKHLFASKPTSNARMEGVTWIADIWSLSASGREEVDEQLVDALGLVVVDPMRGVGQALDTVEVGHVVVVRLGERGAEVAVLLAPDDQGGRRDGTELACRVAHREAV